MARQHERSRARRVALQVLYTTEIQGLDLATLLARNCVLLEEGSLSDYALLLVEGVSEKRTEIDEQLTMSSENWSLMRMPVVDRSILRLAIYEMLYVDEVPVSVAINEAVELAKDFGGEDESPRFVNGVLGKIARQAQAKQV